MLIHRRERPHHVRLCIISPRPEKLVRPVASRPVRRRVREFERFPERRAGRGRASAHLPRSNAHTSCAVSGDEPRATVQPLRFVIESGTAGEIAQVAVALDHVETNAPMQLAQVHRAKV